MLASALQIERGLLRIMSPTSSANKGHLRFRLILKRELVERYQYQISDMTTEASDVRCSNPSRGVISCLGSNAICGLLLTGDRCVAVDVEIRVYTKVELEEWSEVTRTDTC